MQRMLNTQKMLNNWWHQILKETDNQNMDKQFCNSLVSSQTITKIQHRS
jgi:hypothetical protein